MIRIQIIRLARVQSSSMRFDLSPLGTVPTLPIPPIPIPHHGSPPISTTQIGLYSMPALTSHGPPIIPAPNRDGASDFEPDDVWKRQLKGRIMKKFESLIQSNQASQQAQLMKGISREQMGYEAIDWNIKDLMEKEYQVSLREERNNRRWAAGGPSSGRPQANSEKPWAPPTGPEHSGRGIRQRTNETIPERPEELTRGNANQTAHVPSRNPQRGIAPWILASRELHATRKPIDAEFMAHMENLQRKTVGTSLSSPSSSPPSRQISLIGSPMISEPCSLMSSPPPRTGFSPTPVFIDEIPNGLIREAVSSLVAAQAPKGSAPRNLYPLQNSHLPSSSTATPLNSNWTSRPHPMRPPDSTGSVRRGYWNRCGDHLTPDGYVVFPPPNMQYPVELRMYPFENVGYQDHFGQSIAYVRRPELPQSLPKHGNPPECPYESVCFFFLKCANGTMVADFAASSFQFICYI